MIPEKVTTCKSCGFRMHIEEVECLSCNVLADHRERALKTWIAAQYRAEHPQLGGTL